MHNATGFIVSSESMINVPSLCNGVCKCIYNCRSHHSPYFNAGFDEALKFAIRKHFGIPLWYNTGTFYTATDSKEEGQKVIEILKNRENEPIYFSDEKWHYKLEYYRILRFEVYTPIPYPGERDVPTFAKMKTNSNLTIYRTPCKG